MGTYDYVICKRNPYNWAVVASTKETRGEASGWKSPEAVAFQKSPSPIKFLPATPSNGAGCGKGDKR